MKKILPLFFLLLLCRHEVQSSDLSYNPEDYHDVYPDPRDPEVLQGRTPLHFSLLQSLGGEGSEFDATGVVLGVKVALDRINNDTSMLPGYTLHYLLDNSKCLRSTGLDIFHSHMFREPTKIAIIGSGCSIPTEPTAEISHYYNISHISCISSSVSLRDRQRFPYYFQLLRTDDAIAIGFYGIIKEYGWRRIALIVQDEVVFTTSMDILKERLAQDGIEYNERLFSSNDSIAGLGQDIFDEDSRIFLLSMYQDHANAILCEAFYRNFSVPQQVLLTIAWYNRFWWYIESPGLTCTALERESMLPFTLAVTADVIQNEVDEIDFTTTPGIKLSEYFKEESKFFEVPPLNATHDDYSQFCHDATWMLAYALNKTLESISDSEVNADIARAYNATPPFKLEDFSYSNDKLVEIIFAHLQDTSFDGITGPLSFGEEGIRTDINLTVFQYRENENLTDLVKIGEVSFFGNSTFTYVDNESVDTVWEGGGIPYDGVPVKEIVTVHPALTGIFIPLGIVGIVFAIACLIFNLVFRNAKLIKLASTKLNYLIGIGAIVLYINIFFFVIPTTDPDVVNAFCDLRAWLTSIGYSLCFGTILVKMARVYYIFNNPTAKKKKLIQDRVVAMGVVFMLALDMITLIVYTVIIVNVRDNNISKLIPVNNITRIEGEFEIIVNRCAYICISTTRDIFLGILYGYKMLLQVIALILAFSIRKVKVKGLDDAKYIAAAIYVTSIVLAIIIVATYSLNELINVFVGLFCTGFWIGTSAILVLVFAPQMIGLYKDPKGETIFRKSSTALSGVTNTELAADDGREGLLQIIKEMEGEVKEVASLRKRILELESKLQASPAMTPKNVPPGGSPGLLTVPMSQTRGMTNQGSTELLIISESQSSDEVTSQENVDTNL